MPQLDGAAYLSQVTWLVVLFGGYYLLVLNGLLPSVSRRRKVPAKKLRRSGGDQEAERRSTVEGYEASLAVRARESAGVVQRSSTAAARWRAEQKGDLDQKSSANGTWAAALGESKGRGYVSRKLRHRSATSRASRAAKVAKAAKTPKAAPKGAKKSSKSK